MSTSPMKWLNEPPAFRESDGSLQVTTGDHTDFWRETFYGFWHDNGHFYHRAVSGDFSAEVVVQGKYVALYDQAGLMARLSESHWIKCGIEYTDGRAYFSVVVTNDVSDWSLLEIPSHPAGVRLRLTRHREALRVQYLDSQQQQWKMARLCYLPPSDQIEVGMMACSPQRAGFQAQFSSFIVTKPIERNLHADHP